MVGPRPHRHHDLFQRAVARPLADAVDRAFDLPRPVFDAARLLATARPRSLWQCVLITALSMFGTRFFSMAIDAAVFLRRGVADGVGNVDGRRPGFDRRFDDLAEKIALGAGGVFGRKLDVVAVAARPASRPRRPAR